MNARIVDTVESYTFIEKVQSMKNALFVIYARDGWSNHLSLFARIKTNEKLRLALLSGWCAISWMPSNTRFWFVL